MNPIIIVPTVLLLICICVAIDHFKLVSNVRRPGKKRLQKSNDHFRDFNSDSDRGGMVKKLK
jgi:hypothetical protein